MKYRAEHKGVFTGAERMGERIKRKRERKQSQSQGEGARSAKNLFAGNQSPEAAALHAVCARLVRGARVIAAKTLASDPRASTKRFLTPPALQIQSSLDPSPPGRSATFPAGVCERCVPIIDAREGIPARAISLWRMIRALLDAPCLSYERARRDVLGLDGLFDSNIRS